MIIDQKKKPKKKERRKGFWIFRVEDVGRKENGTRCSALVKAFPLDGQGMNHFEMKSTNGRDVLMCSFHGGLPLWLRLPLPVDSPSIPLHLSPGRLSNREEMLGISRCRAEDQMCGLEVVRQTK